MRFLPFMLIGFTFLSSQCKEEEPQKPDPIIPADTIEQIIRIRTNFGDMLMWLHPETPLHRNNFLQLASQGLYNQTTFHRCVPNFVIQGGDPNSKDADSTNDGTGGPGYTIAAEIDSAKFKHIAGAVGAARLSNNVNPTRASNGSQFYIVLPQNGTPFLDGEYTVFGQIFNGLSVAQLIVSQPKNPITNRPYTNQTMLVEVMPMSRALLREQYGFEVR
ncbi:MAG: peptidylprolyl isomerase [Bacteroidia bacterium]|nr:peptidylprolyl isomerase [Bacteroidia bacterium]